LKNEENLWEKLDSGVLGTEKDEIIKNFLK
jgi:hypothetical protein